MIQIIRKEWWKFKLNTARYHLQIPLSKWVFQVNGWVTKLNLVVDIYPYTLTLYKFASFLYFIALH